MNGIYPLVMLTVYNNNGSNVVHKQLLGNV